MMLRYGESGAQQSPAGQKGNLMCSDRRDAKKELDAILGNLLDSIESAPSEEIAEELLAAGQDLDMVSGDVKGSLLAGVKRFEQRKLREAREAYKLRTRHPV